MSQSKHANQRLTPKQDDFCRKFLELKSASAAYREVYDAAGSKPETVHRNATTLLNNSKVATRLDELRAKADQYTGITLEEVSGALRTARVRLCLSKLYVAEMARRRRPNQISRGMA